MVWMLISTLFGLGHLFIGPGIAVVLGIIWMRFTQRSRSWKLILFTQILLATFIITLATSGDPRIVILDEFVAVGIVLLAAKSLEQAVGGVILFALLDSIKPFGIQILEGLPGGAGVVADDVAAALIAAGILLVIIYLRPNQDYRP